MTDSGSADSEEVSARTPPGGASEARDCLALALDTDDLDAAVRLARRLSDYFRVAKVGLELYSASGPACIGALADMGYEVFCDLKLHDIPTTAGRAAGALAKLGASYLTAHAAGGRDMLESAAAGLLEGAQQGRHSGQGRARLLAVTVLTSERDAPEGLLAQRIGLAAEVGCDGIVSAAQDLVVAEQLAAGLIRVVPGIRMPGDAIDDQKRAATPAEAREAGADLLVVGRSVTRASHPVAAAERLHRHLADALGKILL